MVSLRNRENTAYFGTLPKVGKQRIGADKVALGSLFSKPARKRHLLNLALSEHLGRFKFHQQGQKNRPLKFKGSVFNKSRISIKVL